MEGRWSERWRSGEKVEGEVEEWREGGGKGGGLERRWRIGGKVEEWKEGGGRGGGVERRWRERWRGRGKEEGEVEE